MLELAVLGVLKERDAHGYELRKQLVQRLGFFWTVSFGSLYPTLRRLEKRGAIEKIRMRASTRRKQAYRITAFGEREFLTLLEEGSGSSSKDADTFSLRIAFFRYLRPETRVRLLERRRAYLEDRAAEGRRSLTIASADDDRPPLDAYTLSLMRHGVEVTEHDIRWLDGLIDAERGARATNDTPRDPGGTPPAQVATIKTERTTSRGDIHRETT